MDNDNQQIGYILSSIAQDVKEIKDDIVQIKVTAAVQQKDLENHIYRTELLEKQTEMLADSLKPISKHVNMVEGAMKLLGGLVAVAGIAAGLFKFLAFALKYFSV